MRRAGPGALVAALLALTGCAGLPEEGPVRAGEGEAPSSSTAPFDFNPPGPRPGASKEQVAAGFLGALQATPVSTRPAFEFLSSGAAETWRPDRGTIVYSEQRIRADSDGVSVQLDRPFELDRTGRWVGRGAERATGGAGRRLELGMEREDGEWRISELPDAMVIPQSHFASRYREYSLHFFDPTGSVLVPETVYLPWGVQAPTLLVRGLLAGPTPGDRTVERSFFPEGTRLGVSVPVRDDGVAEVPLSAEIAAAPPDQLELVLAQLVWTLRQVPDVDSVQLTVDGTQLDLPGGSNVVDVTGREELSPAVDTAVDDLFGVRRGRIVQTVGDSKLTAVALAGVGRVRSLGVDMVSQSFAVVSEGGRRLTVLPRSGDEAAEPIMEHQGTDLLRPMWDRTDRLWMVDRTAQGAEVVVAHGDKVRRVAAPGLDGTEVLAASLSRDGSRLVAAVRGAAGEDRLVLLRVVRKGAGAPVRLTQARTLPTPEPLRGVRGLGWRDPTTVAVLSRPSATTSQVVLVAGDGSSQLARFDQTLDVLFDNGVALAASPGDPSELVVAAGSGRLHTLDVQGRWEADSTGVVLRQPTFVG